MLQRLLTYTVFLTLPFLLFQCEKNSYEPVPEDLGYTYYPLNEGTVWIYQVDSIAFNSFNPQKLRDTFSYLLRHTLSPPYTVNERDTLYLMKRSASYDEGLTWQEINDWTVYRTRQDLQIASEGVKTVHLVFPVRLFKVWDGNLYNEKDKEDFTYISTSSRFRMNDSVEVPALIIRQRDVENFVQRIYAEEVYGRDVGLCEKRITDLDRIYDSTETNGYQYEMRLIGFYEAP